ncbi:Baculovirus FP protein [Popillia japonica]|uniref:Baculovirus FP protein n=1 Tax=Popillia japonica TaxID=7064 RepID=A0AAW1N383_POPJA
MEESIEKISFNNKVRDAKIEELSDRILELERKDSEKKIELHGVEERDGEKLEEVVIGVVGKLNIRLETADIDQVYRQKKRQTDRDRHIVVQFVSGKKCNEIKNKKRTNITNRDIMRNGTDNKIFIYEHLSSFYKKLFWDAKQRARNADWKYVWIQNGHIFARKNDGSKIFQVRQAKDLDRIEAVH